MLDRRRAVFVLIALAGVLPSALVLWFTSVAIRNEQLAAAQIEEEAREVLLNQIKSDLVRSWNMFLEKVDRRIAGLSPAAAFHETIARDGADGLVILAETPNDALRVTYPVLPSGADEGVKTPVAANLASRFAVLAAALRADDKDKVERAAHGILDNPDFERCVDEGGRHMVSGIELLILETRNAIPESTYASALSRLTSRLNDYRFDLIPASQRRFLMSRVSAVTAQMPTPPQFPTLSAESLSAQFIEANPDLIAGPYLNRSRIEGIWQQRLPSGRGIVLFTEQRMRDLYGEWVAATDSSLAGRVQVEVGSENGTPEAADTELLLGAAFPGWRLRVIDTHAARTPSLKAIYLGLSVASVALILVILIVIASMTLRRLALAQQKNTMVATVSHELKTPVSSIKLLVDTLLQDSVLRPERVKEYLNLISRENLRLSQVIENVLSFSRIERTKFRIEKQQLDIADLIREAVTTFLQQVDITDREMLVEIASDIPPYHGDAWALNRVILNLLDNAYKYSDRPRCIGVSAGMAKSSLVLSVSDRGIGIRKEDTERIFGQFYQADQRLSRSNEGCGLGLSIVEHIVKLHGGSIAVDSELGVGSTFTIRLPMEQQ